MIEKGISQFLSPILLTLLLGTLTGSEEKTVRFKTGEVEGRPLVQAPQGVAKDQNQQPLQVTQVSSLSKESNSPPKLVQPPVTGPAWRDDNFARLFRFKTAVDATPSGSEP